MIRTPIPKEHLLVRLAYGRHMSASDARGLKEGILSFRPHIYAPETAGIAGEERIQGTRKMNGDLALARKGRREMRAFLKGVRDTVQNPATAPFIIKEMGEVANTPGLRFYYIEDVPAQDGFAFLWAMMGQGSQQVKAIDLIRDGRLQEGLAFFEESAKSGLSEAIIGRNRGAAEGYERLLAEAPELFPNLDTDSEVRVFTRFGTLHAGLSDLLESQGFRVETSPLPPLTFRDEISIAITKDPSRMLTDEERLRLLFNDVFMEAFDAACDDAGELTYGIASTYQRIGREQGFVEMLRASAAETTDFSSFVQWMGVALSAVESGSETRTRASSPPRSAPRDSARPASGSRLAARRQ